jgi:hypothetical protein
MINVGCTLLTVFVCHEVLSMNWSKSTLLLKFFLSWLFASTMSAYSKYLSVPMRSNHDFSLNFSKHSRALNETINSIAAPLMCVMFFFFLLRYFYFCTLLIDSSPRNQLNLGIRKSYAFNKQTIRSRIIKACKEFFIQTWICSANHEQKNYNQLEFTWWEVYQSSNIKSF